MTAYDGLDGVSKLPRPIGLALSGGGFRAMLFHLGAIVRLNELRLLRELDEISAVSGGAIVAGRLASAWPRLRFRLGVAVNLWEELAAPLLDFAGKRVDVRAVTRALVPGVSAAAQVEAAYRASVVGTTTLGDLPQRPRFGFLAVHLTSGAPWVFTRRGAESVPIGHLDDPGIPLARAMAASSAYPPFLAPLVLHMDRDRLEFPTLVEPRAVLADGGLYDNLGLHGLWERCGTILSSDAGGVLPALSRTSGFWLRQLIRAMAIHADRSRSLRRHAALEELRSGRKAGTLWRTDADLSSYPAEPAFAVHPSWPPYLAGMRTRMDRFSMSERCQLVNWGYLVADVALRSHITQRSRPRQLPFPALGFLMPAPSPHDGRREQVSGGFAGDAATAQAAR
jgi:NTE family protein